MQKSVREWTLTLSTELSSWELESQMGSRISKNNRRDQNSMDWDIPSIIEKLLEHRCLKWACMTHLKPLKQKLWLKERPGVKLAVWLPTTKSQESPQFPHAQVTCNTPLESSRWEIQLCVRPHHNRRFAHKIMGPQSCGSLNFVNFRTSTWESWDKMPFRCGPHGEAQNII
jgi:hypothetical protein